MRTQSRVFPRDSPIALTDFPSWSNYLSRSWHALLIQDIERKLENFAFTAIISFIIDLLTVYGGWSYTQIELWLANGFLTRYIWKVAKTMEDACKLLEVGFEYICDMDNAKVFRKRR